MGAGGTEGEPPRGAATISTAIRKRGVACAYKGRSQSELRERSGFGVGFTRIEGRFAGSHRNSAARMTLERFKRRFVSNETFKAHAQTGRFSKEFGVKRL